MSIHHFDDLDKTKVDKALRECQRRGHILRVKRGYNPNSSSIGSVVFLLSTKIIVLTAGFGAIAGLIFSTLGKKTAKTDDNKEDTE